MNLPDPEWFTIGDLAQRWGKEEFYVEQLIESRKLEAKVKEFNIPYDASDSKEMREWERANRLIPHPYRLPVAGKSRPFGSKIIVRLSEVLRFEKTAGLPRPYIKKCIEEFRAENASDEKIVYELREMGFANNEIGVALNLGVYREDSNALAVKVGRMYKKYKKC